MPFAEIHEADAPPEIAALYARLRAATGIPVVNLIWRHAATMPGALAWLVAAAEPVIRSEVLQGARDALADLAEPGPFLGFAAAIPTADRALFARIVATYNRGNTTNLLALTALRQAIGGAATGGGALPRAAAPPAMLDAIPPQPKAGALAPETAAAVRGLAALHAGIGEAIPSLYLHLALLPALLAPLRAALAPAFASGATGALRDRLIARAEALAPRFLAGMAPPGPFPAEHAAGMLAALDTFAGGLIAEMTGIGAGLAAAMRLAWAAADRAG